MPDPPPKPEREFTSEDKAYGVARWRIDERKKAGAPVIASGRKGALNILKEVLVDAFDAEYTEAEVRQALVSLKDGIPSKQQLNRELARMRLDESNYQGPGSGLARRDAGQQIKSPADQRVADGAALYEKYAAMEGNRS